MYIGAGEDDEHVAVVAVRTLDCIDVGSSGLSEEGIEREELDEQGLQVRS